MEDNKNYYMESAPEDNGVVDIDIKSYLDKPQKQANVGTYKVGRYDAGIYAAPSVNANVGMLFDDNSRYDDRIQSVNDAISGEKTINQLRGDVQTGFEKVASGVLKGGVLAGTTFVDALLGLPVGLVNLATGGENGEVEFSDVWDNPLTNFLQGVNDWSEKVLPNYYTKEEEERPWYQNIFTANFIGDKLLKNAGFFVGAALGGKVNAGLLSKALGMNKARNAFKGIVDQSNIDDIAESQISKDLVSGKYNFKEGALLDDLAKGGKEINNKSNILKLAGSLTAGMGEARIQTVGNVNSSRETFYQQLEEEMPTIIEEEKKAMPAEYKTVVQTPDGGYTIGLTPEGEDILRERVAIRKENAKAGIEKTLAKMGNVDFALNTALLTVNDWVQLGKYYAGGYKNANKAKTAISGKIGAYKPEKNTVKNILNVAKVPLIEANEEMMQEVAGAASKNMYKQDSWLAASQDPSAISQTNGFISSLAKGVVDVYSDVDQWENFVIGGLIGFGAIPSIGKGASGKKSISFQGGIWDNISELRDNLKKSETLSNSLNQIVEDEQKSNYMRNLIVNTKYENDKAVALDNGDEFEFKNAETSQLVSNIITFAQADRLQDLKDMAKGFANISTQEQVDEIVAMTTNKETGKSVYDGMSNEQIIQSVKNQADQVSDMIDKYSEISQNLQLITGKSTNSEELQELTWQALKIDDWEKRFKSIWSEVQEDFKQFEPIIKDETITINGVKVPIKETLNLSPSEFLMGSYGSIMRDDIIYKDLQQKSESKIKKQEEKIAAKNNKRGLSQMIKQLESLKKVAEDNKEASINSQNLLRKVDDLSQILTARADFMKNYTEYLSTPEKLVEKVQKVKEEGTKKQEEFEKGVQNKKNTIVKDNLKKTETLEQFKQVLEESNVEGKTAEDNNREKERIADELSKEDHPIAMSYMDITNTYKSLVATITDDYAQLPGENNVPQYQKQDIDDAVYLLSRLKDQAQDASELRIPDNQTLMSLNMMYNDEGIPDLTLDRLDNAKKLISRAMKSVNGLKMSHDSAKINLTPTEVAQQTVSVPTPTSEEYTDIDNIGGDFTLEDIAVYNKVNDISKKESKEPYIDFKLEGQDKKHKFWKSSFSENNLKLLEDGKIESFINETNSNMKPIHDIMSQVNPETGESSFTYINKGKLKENDEITFKIDPSVSNKEGIKGFPILMYSGNQLVGILPEAGASVHERLNETRKNIKDEYDNFIKNSEENKNKVFTSSVNTKVFKVLPGRMVFDNKERSLSQLYKDDTIPTFGYVKQGLYMSPNVEDDNMNVPPIDITDREGSLYLRIKGANGKYYPAAVRVKRFNIREFDINDVNVQGTKKYKNIKSSIETIYDGLLSGDEKLKTAGIGQLQTDLYFQGNIYASLSKEINGVRYININNQIPDQNNKELFHFSIPFETGLDSKTASTFTFTIENESGSAVGQKVPKDVVVKNIMSKLQEFNPRFQVSGSKLNKGDYNKELLNSDILTTNLVAPYVVSAWFKAHPISADGTLYTPEQMGLSVPKKINTTTTNKNVSPLGGAETVDNVAVTVTYNDQKYNIDRNGKIIGEVNPMFRSIIEDLAWIKLNVHSDKLSKMDDYYRLEKNPMDIVYIKSYEVDGKKFFEYAGIPEAKKIEEKYKNKKQSGIENLTIDKNMAIRVAIGAGLTVNPDFVPKETSKPRKNVDLKTFEGMMEKYESYMNSRGFTKEIWEQLTDQEKNDQIECASIGI